MDCKIIWRRLFIGGNWLTLLSLSFWRYLFLWWEETLDWINKTCFLSWLKFFWKSLLQRLCLLLFFRDYWWQLNWLLCMGLILKCLAIFLDPFCQYFLIKFLKFSTYFIEQAVTWLGLCFILFTIEKNWLNISEEYSLSCISWRWFLPIEFMY